MAGRGVGWPYRFSPPAPGYNIPCATTTIRTGSTPASDYRPPLSSPWPAAGDAWPAIFFANAFGDVAAGTPSDDVLADWATPEPLVSSLELTAPIESRPVADAGVFADSGVTLQVVGFKQDMLILEEEVTEIYEHLTGAPADDGLVIIPGLEAVHDSYISQPEEVVNVIAW